MKSDFRNYKWGIFYYNPQDRSVFVQKRNRWMGWTLNFANPFAYLIILIVVLSVITVSLTR